MIHLKHRNPRVYFFQHRIYTTYVIIITMTFIYILKYKYLLIYIQVNLPPNSNLPSLPFHRPHCLFICVCQTIWAHRGRSNTSWSLSSSGHVLSLSKAKQNTCTEKLTAQRDASKCFKICKKFLAFWDSYTFKKQHFGFWEFLLKKELGLNIHGFCSIR